MQNLPAKSKSKFGVLLSLNLAILIALNMLTKTTQAICANPAQVTGTGWSSCQWPGWTMSFVKGSEISDIVYTTHGSEQSRTPSYSHSNIDLCRSYARLYYWRNLTNEWVGAANSNLPFISQNIVANSNLNVNCHNEIDRINLQHVYWPYDWYCSWACGTCCSADYGAGNYRVSYSPGNNYNNAYYNNGYGNIYFFQSVNIDQVTFKMKLEVYNSYGGFESDKAEFEHDIIITNSCVSNSVSVGTSPNDIAYTINSASTYQDTVVTGSEGSRCAMNYEGQIWEEGEWKTFSSGTYAWGAYSTVTNGLRFTVSTSDTSLDDDSITESVYYLRVVTDEDYPTSFTSFPHYEYFSVTFNNPCDGDNLVLNSETGTVELQYGQTQTITMDVTRNQHSDCTSANNNNYAVYFWNNSTQAWTVPTTGNLDVYVSKSWNTIRVGGLSTAEQIAYYDTAGLPQVFFRFKFSWWSEYSEHTAATLEEEFIVMFYDDCRAQSLSLSSYISDFEFVVGVTSSGSKTLSYSTNSQYQYCPYTASCYIYDDALQIWTDCSSYSFGAYNGFSSSFSTVSSSHYYYPVWDYDWASTDYVNYWNSITDKSPYDETHTFNIKLSFEANRSFDADRYVEDTFEVTFNYMCYEDELALHTTSLAAQTIHFGENTGNIQMSLNTHYTQSLSARSCPLQYQMYYWKTNEMVWEEITAAGTPTYVEAWTSSTGIAQFKETDYATYDNADWFNVTIKLTVTSTQSGMSANYVEDEFLLTIYEECRTVELASAMTFGSSSYTFNFWQLQQVAVTAADWRWHDTASGIPDSLDRCTMTVTLHWNDADRTVVPNIDTHYDIIGCDSSPTCNPNNIKFQWDYDMGEFDDYFVVQTKVIYNSNTVLITHEAFLYATISNPCPTSINVNPQYYISGDATAYSLSSDRITYNINSGNLDFSVTTWSDTPTTSYTATTAQNTNYLRTIPDNLCGDMKYLLMDADRNIIQDHTGTMIDASAYISIQNSGAASLNSNINIRINSVDEADHTDDSPGYDTYILFGFFYESNYDADYYDVMEEWDTLWNANYSASVTFTVDMDICRVTSVNKYDLLDTDHEGLIGVIGGSSYSGWSTGEYKHIIDTPQKKFYYSPWVQSPACGYTINYSVQWKTYYDTYIDLPPFITWDDANKWFIVQSDDEIDLTTLRQTYTIVLTGTIAASEQDNSIFVDTQEWTLLVTDECPGDTLSLYDDNIRDDPLVDNNYVYYIGDTTDNFDSTSTIITRSLITPSAWTTYENRATGAYLKQYWAIWDTSVRFCPIGFTIYTDVNEDQTEWAASQFSTDSSEVIWLSDRLDDAAIPRTGQTWFERYGDEEPFTEADNPSWYPNVVLNIQTSDYTLDGTEYHIGVARESTLSTVDNTGSILPLTVTFRDICWDVPITASEPIQTDMTTIPVIRWDNTVQIQHAGSEILASLGWPAGHCANGFTHSVLYNAHIAGDKRPDESLADMDTLFPPNSGYSFDNLYFERADWVGTHELKILSTLGVDGIRAGTGEQTYASNNAESSATIQFTVTDPCETTVFDLDAPLSKVTPHRIEAREMGGQVIFQYAIPTDTTSTTYAQNAGYSAEQAPYELCGPRRHYIEFPYFNGQRWTTVDIGPQLNDQAIVGVADWLQFQYFPDGDPDADVQPSYPPVYQIRVNSTDIAQQGLHELTLKFELVDYPESTAHQTNSWPMEVLIEYCLVESWDPPAGFYAYFPVGSKPIQIEYVYQQYPCMYDAVYTAKILEVSGVPRSDQTVPDFIQMDENSGYMTVYTQTLDDLGWYVIEVTATLDVINNLGDFDETNDPDNVFANSFLYDAYGNKIYAAERPPPDFIYASSFNITLGVIEVNETSITDRNIAPYLVPPPDDTIRIIAGHDWEYQLGRVVDWEGDDATVEVEFRNAERLIDFDYDTLTMRIPGTLTDEQTQPIFDIQVTLTDNHPTEPLSRTYDITLVIVKDWTDPLLAVIEQARKEEVFYDYEGRVYDLTETSVEEVTSNSSPDDLYIPNYTLTYSSFDLLTVDSSAQQDVDVANPQPDPVIESFSNDGVATIRFNTPMKVPDVAAITESQVALRLTQAVKTEQFLTEEGIGDFQIRDAIEVTMVPADESDNPAEPIEIDFSWEIIEFTEWYAKFQLHYEIPESISASGDNPDQVQITFWAADLFEGENGKTVRPGLTITSPVIRQVSTIDYDDYKEYGQYTGYMFIGFLALAFVFAYKIDADTLPIWATYDAMVLISHLPLLQVAYPGKLGVLLTEIAKILRLEFIPTKDWLKDWADVGNADTPLDDFFWQNGYESTSIVLNLTTFMSIYALLALLILLSMLKDCGRTTVPPQPNPNGRTDVRSMSNTSKAINSFVRFFMISFFEVFICLLINFKADIDKQNSFENISFIVSIFFLSLATVFISLLFILTAVESDPERDEKDPPMVQLSTIYLNMSNNRRTASNIYLISYMLRRAIFAVIVILMDSYPYLQIATTIFVSGITTAIILRGKIYLDGLSRWTMASLEIVFAWFCAFTLQFSPQYTWRVQSYYWSRNEEMQKLLSVLTVTVAATSFFLMSYSLIWQVCFNQRRIRNIEKNMQMARLRAELERERSEKKQLAPIDEDLSDHSEESVINKKRNKRRARRQQTLRDKINAGLIQDQTAINDGESDDELRELEKLAGIDKLEISDEDDNQQYPPIEDGASSERPNSVGAQSSYSDFMKQWKNKLQGEDNGGPSDVVSNASGAKSNYSGKKSQYSAKNQEIADQSPFKDLSKDQTKNLLAGDSDQVIPEQNEDSDSDEEGIILSKTEQRRLKMLENAGSTSIHSLLPPIQEEAQNTQFSAFDGLVNQLEAEAEQDVEADADAKDDEQEQEEEEEAPSRPVTATASKQHSEYANSEAIGSNQVAAEENLPASQSPGTPAQKSNNDDEDEYELL